MRGKRVNYEELIGKRFGKLVIKTMYPKKLPNGRQMSFALCNCDCGNEHEVQYGSLQSDRVKSCGCNRPPQRKARGKSHGMSNTRFYKVWKSLRERCKNPNVTYYSYYGGRGISFCEEWENFEVFKDDMYESYLEFSRIHGEKNTTIERLDVNGDYSKDNCSWATKEEQTRNTSRVKKYLYKGEMLTIAEIARAENVNYKALLWRLSTAGWDFDRAINEPYRK